jgi:hypothetical protein
VAGSTASQHKRTLEMAHAFLEEVRREVQRGAAERTDLPPRLRSVHERSGHATPEYRTLAVPVSEAEDGASPEALSGVIARYAVAKKPNRLLLALEAVVQDGGGEARPVLIAEARDEAGTRLFFMQPYQVDGQRVQWDEPTEGGWRDPGPEEMILDAAFAGADLRRTGGNGR